MELTEKTKNINASTTSVEEITQREEETALKNASMEEATVMSEDIYQDMLQIANLYDSTDNVEDLTSSKLEALQDKLRTKREESQILSSKLLEVANNQLDTRVQSTTKELRIALTEHNSVQNNKGGITKFFRAIIPSVLENNMDDFIVGIKTSEKNINDVLTKLTEIKIDSEKRGILLMQHMMTLGKSSKELSTQLLSYKLAQEKFDKFLEELREQDPIKAETLEFKVRNDLVNMRKDGLQLLMVMSSARANLSVISENQKQVTNQLKSEMEIAKVALTTGTIVSVAALAQKQDIDVIVQLRKTIFDLNDAATKQIKENTANIKELTNNTTVNVQQLEKGFNEAKTALEATKAQIKIAAQNAEKNANAIEGKAQEMSSQIDIITGELSGAAKVMQNMKNMKNIGADMEGGSKSLKP